MNNKKYFAILDALPQTQCMRCGFDDCAGYAQAIADNLAAINQCPPGGQEGIERLAALTGQSAAQPLNPAYGVESSRSTVWIDEAWCIGCTRCIKVCPVDAIVGSNKLMHTVLEQYCTGCELCLIECPVDCMHTEVVSATASGWQAWSAELAQQAKQRYSSRTARAAAAAEQAKVKTRPKLADILAKPSSGSSAAANPATDKKQLINSLLEKARQARQQRQLKNNG